VSCRTGARSNPQANLRPGTELAGRGECAAAEPHLRKAIASGLPGADPFLSLALCQRTRGDLRGAERTLAEAIRAEPGNPVVEANLGLIAFDSGRLDDAVRNLQAALAIDADLHQARFVLARALAREGQRDAALSQAETLLARLPSNAPQRPEVERLVAALR
jgi:tetratricopeptide (TPR) repeat protein